MHLVLDQCSAHSVDVRACNLPPADAPAFPLQQRDALVPDGAGWDAAVFSDPAAVRGDLHQAPHPALAAARGKPVHPVLA